MKNLVSSSVVICLLLVSLRSLASAQQHEPCFTTALTAGYVFKHDCTFKPVYGRGIVDILTVDGCYYPGGLWGLGAKVSYWRAQGKTTLLERQSILQEVPITAYLRRITDFNSTVQMYASLGGGIIWVKEQSYLGTVRFHNGIGEFELGLNYLVVDCLNLTGAFRYLFPRQVCGCTKVDLGGCDLRAGLECVF